MRVLTLWLAVSLWAIPAAGEPEDFRFGVEQEVRHPFLLFSTGPLMDVALGRPAKEYEVLTNLAVRSYLRLLGREARRRPGEIEIQGNRVYYPKQDWGFRVTADYGTLELIFEPISLRQARALKDTLQHDLWDLAAQRGLRPARFFSAGHVHIALDNFGNDPRKLLNYFIDVANHPELYNGVFGFDPLNAAPPLQTEAGREAFRHILRDFDQGKITTVEQLRERLAVVEGFGKPRGRLQGALNAKTKHPTVEFRATRSHRSADHLLAFLELQALRIDHLNRQSGRIEWKEPGIPNSPREMVAQYHEYVTEGGGDWNRFRMLLPDEWQRIRPDPSQAWISREQVRPLWMRCWKLFSQLL